MRHRKTYNDFVATQRGFNVYRAVDAVYMMTKTMLCYEEQRASYRYSGGRWHVVQDNGWKAVCQRVDKRTKVDCRISGAFLRQLDEQIKRAELLESARLQ